MLRMHSFVHVYDDIVVLTCISTAFPLVNTFTLPGFPANNHILGYHGLCFAYGKIWGPFCIAETE